jgi:hypothetical protein
LSKKWRIIANTCNIWSSLIFLSPFLSKHNRETQHSSSTHPNNCKLLTGTVPNMLMKRFVGGGDDWCVHMDVMVMVFQGLPLKNLPASPAAYNATTNQRLEQQRWAVVVTAMATATVAGTTATTAAAAAAKTTVATARQWQRRKRGQQRHQRCQ